MSAQSDLYDQMVEDVVVLTNRPDLAAEIAIAVRTATLSIHMRAAFPRDVAVQLVKLPNASYVTSLDVQVLLPRIRGVSSLRVCDVNYDPLETPIINIVEMGDIYDPEYKTLRNDVAYLAGTALNIRSSISTYGYLIEYFQVPLLRREQYNSWIAQLAPDAIMYTAAATVLATSGDEDKAAAYNKLVTTTLFPELIQNFLTSAMR